jgi:hypothetical protein
VSTDEKLLHKIFEVDHISRKTHAAEFALFERHKSTLLNILRDAHDGGPRLKPFDEQYAWSALMGAAMWYFPHPILERNAMLPARRFERLQNLAKALGRARRLANAAMQDNVGRNLFRGWWTANKGSKKPITNELLDAVSDEITDAVAKLAALEAAASRAARDVPKKVGPQSGTGILSMHDINALRKLYRLSTGREPRRGPLFVQLVEEFLVAVGKGNATKGGGYVVDALKYADRQAREQSRLQTGTSANLKSTPRSGQ